MQPVILTPTDPDDPTALFCWGEYFALLNAKIANLPPGLFPLPDPDAAAYRPPQGCLLIAHSGPSPVGCVALRPLDGATAEVKRLWVAPAARGFGLARHLMQAVEDQARAMGYTDLKLDTNAALPEAIALYAKTGWSPTDSYSDPPATHWFHKGL